MLWNNVSDTFPESRNVKGYENVKLVNLSSCKATQMSLILCMISKNSDFGVGGNIKFFTEANFILMNTKFTTLTRKLSSNYPHPNQVDILNGFWDIIKSVTKNCPSWKSGKTSQNKNCLDSTSYYQRYTKFTSGYIFLWMTNVMQWVEIICASPKTSKSKMAANYGLKIRSRY